MKQKIYLIIIMLLFGIIALIPNKTMAASSSGYTIEKYNIKVVVHSNNTFDVTEEINANFDIPKHGIFRKIPVKNTVMRQDYSTSKNKAKVKNIRVNDSFEVSTEKGYKVIKIGSASKTYTGQKKYIIKYKYDIGKDPLKNADELYYNLIGNQWDTSIDNVTFSIIMPKEFDKEKLGFSCGRANTADSSKINFEVIGNTITGSVTDTLNAGEGLTVRLTLPEGYFSGRIDWYSIFVIILCLAFVLIAYMMWSKYGKDDPVIETVEFYPPEGFNSAEIGYMYEGKADTKSVISLLVYLADKGYLKIEETGKKGLLSGKNSFRIIKLKDYDGGNISERKFFDGLFAKKRKPTINELKSVLGDDIDESNISIKQCVKGEDLYDSFYVTVDSIKSTLNSRGNKYKIFESVASGKRKYIIFMIIAIIAVIFGKYIIENEISIMSVMTGLISIGALVMFYFIMPKRTPYGNEMLGKIRGFKRFLETAEKPQLEELVSKNPEYYYNILPYTYALGVSKVWMKQFETIAMQAPNWYNGYDDDYFDTYRFNRFMDNTMRSATAAMISTPQSSSGSGFSSGGGFTGGGFSGGGSGGGGGGSW